ncbi:MAG: hypothetical protein H6Q89_4874 [Myxococcaceae bacterium]|nr:hypothetical protein [Myxococcaceae bacterium]
MPAPEHPTLPPALDALLDGFEDRLLSKRLRAVHRAASTAIESLSSLNLVNYEPASAEEGSADLDMWEKMAAPVAETVSLVSTALAEMRQQFKRAFDRPPGQDAVTAVTDWRASEEIESVIGAINRRLEYELNAVRSDLRRPEVVSSRWRLLAELQEVRAGFRRQLGDLVFLTTNVLAHTPREAVVPGHQSEVSRTAQLRRGVARFSRKLRAGASTPDLEPAALVDGVLEALAGLAAEACWKLIAAGEKRALIALREQLSQPEAKSLSLATLQSALEPNAARLEALLAHLNESLAGHDRDVWAECSVRLGQVELHLNLGSNGGPRIFSEALEVVESLHGRDPQLDEWLQRALGLEARRLAEAELREELARFKEQLALLPFH